LSTQVFISLPTDDNAACVVADEDVCVMVLKTEYLATLTERSIVDPDGKQVSAMWMDPAAEQGPEVFVAEQQEGPGQACPSFSGMPGCR